MMSIIDARRKLLAVDLNMVILTNSDNAAENIQASVQGADLSAVNLPQGATVGAVRAVINVPFTTTPPPIISTPVEKSNLAIIIAVVVSAFVVISLFAALLYFYFRRRSVQQSDIKILSTERDATPPVQATPLPDVTEEGPTAEAPENEQRQEELKWSDLTDALSSMRFLSSRTLRHLRIAR